MSRCFHRSHNVVQTIPSRRRSGVFNGYTTSSKPDPQEGEQAFSTFTRCRPNQTFKKLSRCFQRSHDVVQTRPLRRRVGVFNGHTMSSKPDLQEGVQVLSTVTRCRPNQTLNKVSRRFQRSHDVVQTRPSRRRAGVFNGHTMSSKPDPQEGEQAFSTFTRCRPNQTFKKVSRCFQRSHDVVQTRPSRRRAGVFNGHTMSSKPDLQEGEQVFSTVTRCRPNQTLKKVSRCFQRSHDVVQTRPSRTRR